MIAIIWLGTAFHLAAEQRISQEAAIQNSGNLARAFEEHLVRSIKEVDNVLLFLRANYEKSPADFDFAKLAKNAHLSSDVATRLSIIGADGFIKLSSAGPLSAPVDLRDRGHFQIHRYAVDDALVIGTPLISRLTGTGEWLIPLARRIRNKDGSFGGVISAIIDTSYFTKFYNAINLGSDGAIALIGLTDGVFLASKNAASNVAGQTVTDFLAYLSHLTAPDGWYFSDAAWSDGVQRLVSYRKVKEFPLVVMVGISNHQIFASTGFKQQVYDGIVMVSTALILLIIAFNIRKENHLARTRSALHSQNFRFDTALNNMSQGLCMFDAEQRLIVCNERYRQLYDLSREQVKPGTTLHQIFEYRIANGLFAGASPAEYMREVVENRITRGSKAGAITAESMPTGGAPVTPSSSHIRELSDGRTIAVVNQPMAGGGWVATHEDITERRRAESQIAYMAHHDHLTALPNRARFAERLEETLGSVGRGAHLAVLFLDLDHFKNVNDTLGHLIGDELLTAVADRLRSCVRETDMVARLGGDEFAIIQTAIEQPNDVAKLANRIQAAVKAPYHLGTRSTVIDVSIGIALAPSDATEQAELMKRADMALYKAKADGRGTYRFFEPEMDTRMKARRQLELDLRDALVHGELELFYQPVVTLQDNAIVGFEALLRWHHPERGMILPAEFIPVAEETGFIVPLGEWVIRQACSDAASWPADIKVAVNLSPAQFNGHNLTQTVISALSASGVAPGRLELEITESVLLSPNDYNLATLHQLRALGVSIALDDFGTGYSSLSYLCVFPFDKIKIDRSFVNAMAARDDCAAIVCAVANLGRSLNIVTTAEGVETEEQLVLVRAAGCSQVQGYLFGRAVPVSELNFGNVDFKPTVKENTAITATDIMLVRASFLRVVLMQDVASDLFYNRLFELAPELRVLFADDLSEQKRKLMAMLGTAVGKLDDLATLLPSVKSLGARHVAYGAKTEHYAIVGQALLWTLERGLGDAFTADMRSAWTKVYDLLATTMQAGAVEAAAVRAADAANAA